MSLTLEEKLLHGKAGKQWEKVGVRHHHGIALPLFSLHTELSCGIGEYTDLPPLIDFCKSVNFDVIQLLPLNDTGPDNSPYNILSAMALHPIYIGLHQLPNIDVVHEWEAKISEMRKLNTTKRVHYSKILHLKKNFLNEYFHHHFPAVSQTVEYQNFVEENSWLYPYALFKALKEQQHWKAWQEWPTPLKSPSNTYFQTLLHEFDERVRFHIFEQYLCFQQMRHAKKIADASGVFLKGDIPILLSRDSADVWAHRNNFLLHLSAGSPPDAYSSVGQYWGFPIYDWHEIEKNGYNFWKTRLKVASQFYHLYRVDHVVGFFRIWAIPLDRPPLEGSFVPADESMWISHGSKIMEMMLETTTMLPIGEDLGVVPPGVRVALTELGIPGTKMMRWERYWGEGDEKFIPPQDYQPISMTTISTQDSDTLQLWWQHCPKEAKIFAEFKNWSYKPFLLKEQHQEILFDAHHSGSLFHINLFSEYLALFPELTSIHLQDERINVPGKVLPINWTYRFRLPLEKIHECTPLLDTMKAFAKTLA